MTLTRLALVGCLLLAPLGCVSGGKAKAYAAVRSGCKADNIEMVRQDGHDLVLNVCGVYEDWRWHAFNGWEYLGPSAEQPLAGPMDADRDGVPDDVDACPGVMGVATLDPATNGCPPPPDADSDGVPDAVDACPQQIGVAQTDPAKNGCPLPGDKDGDGVMDDKDACPEEAGLTTVDPATNGCPDKDRDKDGILNETDACPDAAGNANEDPAKNGCPLVSVTKEQIVITERIEFDTGKATIKPVSDALLDSIAQVLKDNPDITKVEIQGHTDDKGSKNLNRRLSDDRAASVRKALIERGVAPERLTSKGYGPDKPLVPNDDDVARQKNRRVQFQIVERAAAPASE